MKLIETKRSSDLRTREGRRNEVLNRVREFGGFSVFWVTENYLRSCVATEMQESGEIITDTESSVFPWIKAKIAKEEEGSNEN